MPLLHSPPPRSPPAVSTENWAAGQRDSLQCLPQECGASSVSLTSPQLLLWSSLPRGGRGVLAGILCPPAQSGSMMSVTVDPDPPPTLQSRYCSSSRARTPQAKAHPGHQDHMETSSSSEVCDTVRTCPKPPPRGRLLPLCFLLRPQKQVPLFQPSQTGLRRRKLST